MASFAGLMVGVTAVDVVMRWFGLGGPGWCEIVTLGMRILIPLALPVVFWISIHVSVEMLVDRFLTVAESVKLTSDLQLPQVVEQCPRLAPLPELP